MRIYCSLHMYSRHLPHLWVRVTPMRFSRRYLSKKTLPDLTSVRYPKVRRGNFAQLSSSDVDFFKKVLPGEGRVLTEADNLDGYNTDWLHIVRGSSQLVLRPRTTAEVAEILRYCDSRRLAVCPQGGNTGLVGGSNPVFDEIILSTQLMNKIISVDDISGILVCQSGCVLENLDKELESHGLMMPLDLAAKGSCHIGGNVSTNAGGVRVIRYGSLHGSVLGIEAVLASGEIVNCLSTLRKDNTGYDVKQLFIGAEGTLGIVTAVSILCPSRPRDVSVAFLATDSFTKILETLKSAKKHLGEILSAYEFLDWDAMHCAQENLHLRSPLGRSPFYVLIETSGSNGRHDEEKLNSFLEEAMQTGLVTDGTIATDSTKVRHLWEFRERLAESLLPDGYNYKYDLSIPITKYYDLVEVMRSRCAGKVTRTISYGHIGDSNLHLNFTSPEYSEEVKELIEPYIYEWTSQHSGSISAEHGLGFMKSKYIHMSKTKPAVDLMRNIKQVMDPNGIMNPYKTLP